MSPPPSLLLLLLLLLLISAVPPSSSSCSSSCVSLGASKAVYSRDANPSGACGYQLDHGVTLHGGFATAVGRLYNNGTGCGACYRLRCTDQRYCNGKEVNVVVTDHGLSAAGVDFILSAEVYAELAVPKYKDQLLALGSADIDYCRIPCTYPGHNLVIKVKENSEYPIYLAITFLYQWGKYDIMEVQVSRWCHKWIPMRHAYGKVWDLEQAPSGPLNLKFLAITEYGDEEWMYLENIIPLDWKLGQEFDTGL